MAETRDLNENVPVELDTDGNIVNMTIEHARQQIQVAGFSF